MENKIAIFENNEFGKIRVLDIEGKPWFVGKDVAEILGYKETAKAVREKVDADDKGVSILDTPGGKQEVKIINESGLYYLILSSKLPKAKEFKRWVTNEVLPSVHIRNKEIAMNLVKVENNQVVVSSRDIAAHFGKAHGDVLKSIDSLVRENSLTKTMFFETSREYRGQSFRYYLMNRDGFSLLVMGFTGSKALDWKLKYIEAFNEMEKELKERDFVKPVVDVERNQIDLNNSKARLAELWMELADRSNIPEFKQVADTYAANTLAEKEVFALPAVTEKTYTATEIGKLLGVSASKIGRLANTHGLKTSEYGKYFYDKSKYSNKEVETFRYFKKAIEVFRNLLA